MGEEDLSDAQSASAPPSVTHSSSPTPPPAQLFNRDSIKGLWFAMRDSAIAWKLDPLRAWGKEEWNGMKHGRVLCLFLVVCSLYAGTRIESHFDQSKLSEKDGTIGTLKQQHADDQADVVRVRVDANESARRQGQEISDLKVERASLQQQLATFSALPPTTLNIVSNLLVMQSNGVINQQQLQEMITNALASGAEEKPSFSIQVNGQAATNGAIIQIGPDNIVNIAAFNQSHVTATALPVECAMNVAESNISAAGWSVQPHLSINGQDLSYSSHYRIIADHPTAGMGNLGLNAFSCNSIRLSTNVNQPIFAFLQAYSDRSTNLEFFCVFNVRQNK